MNKSKKAFQLNELIIEYNLPRNEVVMIGDRSEDIEASKNNQVDSIGVTYGFENWSK